MIQPETVLQPKSNPPQSVASTKSIPISFPYFFFFISFFNDGKIHRKKNKGKNDSSLQYIRKRNAISGKEKAVSTADAQQSAFGDLKNWAASTTCDRLCTTEVAKVSSYDWTDFSVCCSIKKGLHQWGCTANRLRASSYKLHL